MVQLYIPAPWCWSPVLVLSRSFLSIRIHSFKLMCYHVVSHVGFCQHLSTYLAFLHGLTSLKLMSEHMVSHVGFWQKLSTFLSWQHVWNIGYSCKINKLTLAVLSWLDLIWLIWNSWRTLLGNHLRHNWAKMIRARWFLAIDADTLWILQIKMVIMKPMKLLFSFLKRTKPLIMIEVSIVSISIVHLHTVLALFPSLVISRFRTLTCNMTNCISRIADLCPALLTNLFVWKMGRTAE